MSRDGRDSSASLLRRQSSLSAAELERQKSATSIDEKIKDEKLPAPARCVHKSLVACWIIYGSIVSELCTVHVRCQLGCSLRSRVIHPIQVHSYVVAMVMVMLAVVFVTIPFSEQFVVVHTTIVYWSTTT